MQILQKITTTYEEEEDRLRLAGEDAAGEAVVLWLTQRLANRLVPALAAWLDEENAAGDEWSRQTCHSWAQTAARAQLSGSDAVRAGGHTPQRLVAAIDLNRGPERYGLAFKGQDEATATLNLTATELRQWLAILHQAFLKAGWPRPGWPEWLEPVPDPSSRTLH